jgi:hypothetical protein
MLLPKLSRSVYLGVKHPPRAQDQIFITDERTSVPFTIAADPRQRSHSQVQVPRDWWPYFTVSVSRLSQPGGPGPRIYIPQEQGGPVIPSGTGLPFHRLLRLAGMRRRYSTPPLRGNWSLVIYIASTRPAEKTPLSTALIFLHACLLRL